MTVAQDDEESSGHGSGMEEWGNASQNQSQSQSPEPASASARGSGSPVTEGEIPREEEVEGELEDGVLIAAEQEGVDDDYFDESAEGKEFEE